MVLTHRRSQQRVTRSVEHESINGAIELRQCLAQGARRVAWMSMQRFRWTSQGETLMCPVTMKSRTNACAPTKPSSCSNCAIGEIPIDGLADSGQRDCRWPQRSAGRAVTCL